MKHNPHLLLVSCLALSAGCAQMPTSITKAMPWAEKGSQLKESKYQAPVKMVALWSPAMYNAAGKKPTRGFGGRLYFYNAKNETIPVEGQLVVYGFNDTNKSTDHKQADRRIAYTPEQFSGHFSPTELGASYSIWVPWDAVGNPQAEISLLPVFTAASGQVVIGQQSIGLLPGPETPVPEGRFEETISTPGASQASGVKRVSYDEPTNGTQLNTTSITLPQDLAERIAAVNQQAQSIRMPTAEELVQMRAQVARPIAPNSVDAVPAAKSKGTTESSLAGPTRQGLFPPLAPLTRSAHFPPQVPASRPPPPVPGLPPSQPPPAAPQSALPSLFESAPPR